MNYNNNEEPQDNQTNPIDWIPLIILSAIIGFVPMVVYMRVINYDYVMQEIFGRVSEGNFFSYYKAVWLYILTGSCALWFLANARAKACWYHTPLAVYGFLAILSTVFAQFRIMALWGDPCRHEGLVAHLCYITIVFLFIQLIKGQRELRFLLYSLLISAGILGIAGSLQFFGYDYFFNGYSTALIVPKFLREALPHFSLNNMQETAHSVFLTFGNGNFTGSYMTMLFALSFALIIGLPEKWKKVLIPLNLLILVCLLGCKSRAGQYSSLIACITAMLFLRKSLRANLKLLAILLAVYILMPFAMDAYTWKAGLPRFLETSLNRPLVVSTGLFGRFDSLDIEKDEIRTVFDGVQLKIRYNNERIEFYDETGNLVSHRLVAKPSDTYESTITTDIAGRVIPSTFSPAMMEKLTASQTTPVIAGAPDSETNRQTDKAYLVVFPEKKLRGFIIHAWPDYNLMRIGRGGVSFFVAYVNNSFTLLNQFFRPVTIQEVPAFGFKGREGFASNRGYIWSRSIPMLKDTLLLGFGPDTFAAHFPNHDYIGKLRVWSSGIFLMVEKPHNLYLQIALNTGLISLLAFLAIILRYSAESYRLYWKSKFQSFTEIVGVALFAAITAYLLAGIFNDSINGVAPVFWSLLGLGIATNRINSCNNE